MVDSYLPLVLVILNDFHALSLEQRPLDAMRILQPALPAYSLQPNSPSRPAGLG